MFVLMVNVFIRLNGRNWNKICNKNGWWIVYWFIAVVEELRHIRDWEFIQFAAYASASARPYKRIPIYSSTPLNWLFCTSARVHAHMRVYECVWEFGYVWNTNIYNNDLIKFKTWCHRIDSLEQLNLLFIVSKVPYRTLIRKTRRYTVV